MSPEARRPIGPPWDLEEDEYLSLMREWSVSDEEFQLWRTLWPIFADRTGWHFFIPEIEDRDIHDPIWAFGIDGAARIAISVQEGSYFLAYVAETDTEHSFATHDDLAAWIDKNEAHYEGFTELQEELFDYLLPRHLDEWKNDEDGKG